MHPGKVSGDVAGFAHARRHANLMAMLPADI